MSSLIYAFGAALVMASAFLFFAHNTLLAAGLAALAVLLLIAFVLTIPPTPSPNSPDETTSTTTHEMENSTMSQKIPGELPSLGEMAAQINERKRRIAAGDTKLGELQTALYAASDAMEKVEEVELAEARKRLAASSEYAAWRLAAQRLADYEHELDISEGK